LLKFESNLVRAPCHDGKMFAASYSPVNTVVDVSYAAPQVHGIVNVALPQDYSLGIVFIFSQGRKDLYHV
jgi:hypothetical protein